MNIEGEIVISIQSAIENIYGNTNLPEVKIEKTNADFVGDYTFVVFPFVRFSKKSPEITASEIGEELTTINPKISSFNVVKGFLNLSLNPSVWSEYHQNNWLSPNTFLPQKESTVMVEYSSPNTNKPLHLGHIRNNLLGYSIAQILDAAGNNVIKANLINDRGIHICKSMLAWQRFGDNETPEIANLKGDHLVGKYYVVFENKLKEQTEQEISDAFEGKFFAKNEKNQIKYNDLFQKLQITQDEKQSGKIKDDIKDLVRNQSELMQSCQEMLRKWENGDADVLELWNKMNNWVYAGFENTYHRLGVRFDKYYYESKTYTLGKKIVQEGLEKGVFYQKEDGSIWVDLTPNGLDHKLLLRSDGTSVYITQDMGTAELKYSDFKINKSIYVVGNEQDYHFNVLFLIMQKLDRPYAKGMYHASYGMVDLPSGKMKSREGTVVDADDLLNEMYETAKQKTIELGKTEGLSHDELDTLYHNLSLAALKFFILKVDPKKRMLFNPADSIDFQGDTGPFVIYTYARIQSILKQAKPIESPISHLTLHVSEIGVIKQLYAYPSILNTAAEEYNPAAICQYCLDLAKAYNRLYNDVVILKEENAELKNMRLQLAQHTSTVLKSALELLGISTVDRM
jgi:arginyl-tRNA synthetase